MSAAPRPPMSQGRLDALGAGAGLLAAIILFGLVLAPVFARVITCLFLMAVLFVVVTIRCVRAGRAAEVARRR